MEINKPFENELTNRMSTTQDLAVGHPSLANEGRPSRVVGLAGRMGRGLSGPAALDRGRGSRLETAECWQLARTLAILDGVVYDERSSSETADDGRRSGSTFMHDTSGA